MSERACNSIIGESDAIRQMREDINRIAPLRLPVTIEGPTGSGKELVARALHDLSGRRGRFVDINVCAIAETMFEAMFFGYVRGAFTSAIRSLPGYFVEADRGTLFLDEIGGLAAAHQIKLLRAIETQQFRPIGARLDCSSDFRVIGASNEPINALVEAGRFRADLRYRLAGIVLTVPPLRDRREDIPLLVAHYARTAGGQNRINFTSRAMSALQEHDWPGNVRELRHVVERAVLLSTDANLDRGDVLRFLTTNGNGNGNGTVKAVSHERKSLTDLLERCGWDTAEAAAQLGVARSTVYRRMERLHIHP